MQDSLATRIAPHRLVITAMASVLILFAAAPITYQTLFLLSSEITTGTAVELGYEYRENAKGGGGGGTSLIIEFTTAAGETQRFDGGSQAYAEVWDIGDHFPVRYDPGNPDHAEIDDTFLFFRINFFPLVILVLGAGGLGAVAWSTLILRFGLPHRSVSQ